MPVHDMDSALEGEEEPSKGRHQAEEDQDGKDFRPGNSWHRAGERAAHTKPKRRNRTDNGVDVGAQVG